MAEQSLILLVEDREDDVLLVKKALARSFIHNPLHVVRSGEEALAYLKGEDQYSNRAEYPLPELLLLDLKLPGMDGFEVLEWVRSHPAFCALRIVVLTSSDLVRDANRAYQLGANSFLVKPMELENYSNAMRLLAEYWLKSDRPPTLNRPDTVVTPQSRQRSR